MSNTKFKLTIGEQIERNRDGRSRIPRQNAPALLGASVQLTLSALADVDTADAGGLARTAVAELVG